jgi:hypothetical protein
MEPPLLLQIRMRFSLEAVSDVATENRQKFERAVRFVSTEFSKLVTPELHVLS